MAEDCYHLDIVMDVKKPHWTWVQDILANYRTAPIYSNGQYKLISDRADLPTRQVFHAGNMIPGRTEVRIGGDPLRPNQAVVHFAAEDREWEQEIRYVVSSAALAADSGPIKPFDMSLIGITRWTEALRAADVQLKRRRQIRREITFATGLEALAVEPGDIAICGVLTTDFEMGYGGRALDGSSNHIVLDREVEIRSGQTYDMHVWHATGTAADTYELRTVATTVPAGQSTYKTITISPTAGFSFQVVAQDRYAIGITSEDLRRYRVTRIRRSEAGFHEVTAEEFIPIGPDLECPGSAQTTITNTTPSQPQSATATASGCILCANVVTVPTCVGGNFTGPNSFRVAYISTSLHSPIASALVGELLRIASGPASGYPGAFSGSPATAFIQSYTGATSYQIQVPAIVPFSKVGVGGGIPNSGDLYYITHHGSAIAGLGVDIDCGDGFARIGNIIGTSGCIGIDNTCERMGIRLIPFNDRGLENPIGVHTFSLTAEGCADSFAATTTQSFIGTTEQAFFTYTVPASEIVGFPDRVDFDLVGRITEVCSPNEQTLIKFKMTYGASTIVDSLVVTLNRSDSVLGIGADQFFNLTARLQQRPGGGQFGRLTYGGPSADADGTIINQDLSVSGTGSADPTQVNTFRILELFSHAESHNCFSVVFDAGEITVTTSE